ncbi:MAG: hypothetical protein L0170_05710 [Acidobacteria bacterium]|nr:hypothetical protein [Acidobacteriota bacterium]
MCESSAGGPRDPGPAKTLKARNRLLQKPASEAAGNPPLAGVKVDPAPAAV